MGLIPCDSIVCLKSFRNIFPVIDLIVLVGLNWKEMEFAELAFSSVIGPVYRNNRESLEKVTDEI